MVPTGAAAEGWLASLSHTSRECRLQSRYVVERASGELWLKVLDEANPDRRALIDQVGATIWKRRQGVRHAEGAGESVV